jgi:hypothetical protein
LEIAGGLFVVAVAAAVTVAAEGAATSGTNWRRAAASTTHETGDCTGASGLLPNNGVSTESTTPLATAGWA